MGSIVAALNKRSKSSAETVITMLDSVKPRRSEKFGIASPSDSKIEETLRNLRDSSLDSSIIIGQAFSKALDSDRPQPVTLNNGTIVVGGRVFAPEFCKLENLINRIEARPEFLEDLIRKFDGDFAFAKAERRRLLVGRDSLGSYPFYYGENSKTTAVATMRQALWRIGIKDVHSFPPGNLAVMSESGFRFKHVKSLSYAPASRMKLDKAVEGSQILLEEAVAQRLSGTGNVALAFSGGLDSAVIAAIARDLGADVTLISVSLENQSEIRQTKQAAECLGLPIHFGLYDEKDVGENLPEVIRLLEEYDPVKVSIGVPVFWAAENASRIGLRIMLSGQGADELFGGYKRYIRHYLECGRESVEREIFNDISTMHERNLERDMKICAFHNIELRLPFASFQLAEFASSLPVQLKIGELDEMVGKAVLRKIGQNLRLPPSIFRKPKKAIQYSTGVNKIIKKDARRGGSSVREFVKRIFDSAFEGYRPE